MFSSDLNPPQQVFNCGLQSHGKQFTAKTRSRQDVHQASAIRFLTRSHYSLTYNFKKDPRLLQDDSMPQIRFNLGQRVRRGT